MKLILSLCVVALLALASANQTFATAISPLRDKHSQPNSSTLIKIAASNCAAKANSLAASYSNAQILSVKKSGNSCVIVIRVNGKNGNPPRVITKTVSG
jgi:hypothetical protein